MRDLRLPGLYYDELIQVVPSLEVLRGGLWSSVIWIPSSEVSLFGHRLPLMTMDYMGSLKTMLFLPIVAAAGVTPESVRIPTITIGALSLLSTFAFCRRVAVAPVALLTVALLATNLSFIYYVRVDYGPTALMMFLKSVALWKLVSWWQQDRIRDLAIGAFALGLGVYNKVDFLWIVFGIAGAAVLIAPRAVRRRVNLRASGTALTAFALGAAPLIYYNFKWPMPTLVALSGSATAGGPTGAIADQLQQRFTVLEHLLDGTLVKNALICHACPPGVWTGGLAVWLVVAAAAVAVVGAAPWARTSGWRVGLFALLVMLLVLIAAAATRGGFAGHHVILTYPFPQLLAAYGVLTLLHWMRPHVGTALAVLIAAVVSGATLAQSALTTNEYLRMLTSSGGSGSFSDAIYALESVLDRQQSATSVVALDWGFHFPLVGLSQGRIHSVESTDASAAGSTAELRDFLVDADVRYVAHAPGAMNFPRRWQAFTDAARAAGLQPILEQRFGTRDGEPVIDIYRVRPASPEAGRESLLVKQAGGAVGQVRAEDQVRILADIENAAPTLLTISPGRTSYLVDVPDGAHLRFSIAQPENVWTVTTGAIAVVTVIDGDQRFEIFRRNLAARVRIPDRTWSDVDLDLSSFARRAVVVELAAFPPQEGEYASSVIWRDPSLIWTGS